MANSTPSDARTVNDAACIARSRRDACAALGATVLVGVAVAGFCRPEMLAQTACLPNPDATLLHLVARLKASAGHLRDLSEPYYEVVQGPPIEVQAEIAQVVAINRDLRISAANIPARGLRGRQAKAWALLEEWGLEVDGEAPEDGDKSHLLWSLACDVLAETV